jgi:CBS-domain-containing membrane protein
MADAASARTGAPVTKPVRLARETRVESCQDLLAIGPLLVHRDDDIIDIVRRSALQPATRTLGVIDDEGRIVGVIRVLRLTESVVARVAPASVMAGLKDAIEVGRFGHAVEDRIASDIMEAPATISPEATVGEAFREMQRHDVTGLYVVDAERRPTGYVDLLELAIRLVDALADEGAAGDVSAAGGSNTDDTRAEGS